METITNLAENIWVQRIFWILIVVGFSFLVYRILTGFLTAREKRSSKFFSDKKNKTFLHMLKNTIGYIIAILAFLMILRIFGVDVTSMLAGVGIAGIVIGFALQDALKDIVRGFNIVSDNYYEIGDVIQYEKNIGKVTAVSLLTTKIQDMNTMNEVSIANRNIEKVEIVSTYIYLQVPLPYEIKVDRAEAVMTEITKRLRNQKLITSAIYQGVTKLNTSSLDYQIVINCDDAMHRLQARRDAFRVIITTLEEHKIPVPYQQLDVSLKK